MGIIISAYFNTLWCMFVEQSSKSFDTHGCCWRRRALLETCHVTSPQSMLHKRHLNNDRLFGEPSKTQHLSLCELELDRSNILFYEPITLAISVSILSSSLRSAISSRVFITIKPGLVEKPDQCQPNYAVMSYIHGQMDQAKQCKPNITIDIR